MHRPLPAALVVLLAVLSVAGVEVWTRLSYKTRDGLLEKAHRFTETARPEDNNLVILGTCLPEQHINADLVEARLGGGWVVHNLGNQATSTLDWQLTFRNGLPLDRVDGLVIATGARDLTALIRPWESRVLDLATWRDLPDLSRYVCADAECTTDLALRTVSKTWRYRARIANRVWKFLGALTSGGANMPPPVAGQTEKAAMAYLARLLADAKAHDIPTWLLPLPTQHVSDERATAAYHAAVDPVLADGGAKTLAVPNLDARYFTDDAHLTREGTRLLSEAFATALRADLGLPEPPPYVSPTTPASNPRPFPTAGAGAQPPIQAAPR